MVFRVRFFIRSIFLPILLFVPILLYLFNPQPSSDQIRIRTHLTTTSVMIPKCPAVRNGYCIVINYLLAKAKVGYEDSITFITQSTVDFLHHVTQICWRWLGPISVSVYAPSTDFGMARQVIEKFRNKDECVLKWVSWHLIYDENLAPENSDFSIVLPKTKMTKVNTSSKKREFVYPINVARNVARFAARTKFVLTSEIEIYPSKDVIPLFLDFIQRLGKQNPGKNLPNRQVYVLPVFEVSKGESVPLIKSELLSLIARNKADYFHHYICGSCHQIPNYQKWIETNTSHPEMITVFHTTKRNRKQELTIWEPTFISTNEIPFFDERLNWNGMLDKMSNAFELCLLDYDFVVLDGAFMTHTPGIKVRDKKEDASRATYMFKNRVILKEILGELREKYGTGGDCD